MPLRNEAADRDLEPFGRRVHVTRGAASGRLLTQYVPGLDSTPELQVHTADLGDADQREPELQERQQPGQLELDAVGAQIGDDLNEVGENEVRQQESLMQRGAP